MYAQRLRRRQASPEMFQTPCHARSRQKEKARPEKIDAVMRNENRVFYLLGQGDPEPAVIGKPPITANLVPITYPWRSAVFRPASSTTALIQPICTAHRQKGVHGFGKQHQRIKFGSDTTNIHVPPRHQGRSHKNLQQIHGKKALADCIRNPASPENRRRTHNM